MKTLNTTNKRKTSVIVGFIAAMLLVVASFLSVQNGPSHLTAAAVVERGNQPAVTADSAAEQVANQGTPEPTINETSPAKTRTVVENRMTDEAKKAAQKVKSIGGGEASYYGAAFAGRPTANGETFDPSGMTAAHRTLPFGTKLRVTNTVNGRSVVVRVNDRGPYAHNRVIDLAQGAAERIGMIHSGTAQVRLEVIS